VTVQVPVAKLPAIAVGQAATVTPPGLGTLKGSVTQIALLPTATTGAASATVTYAVTVTLPDTPTTLATGSYAPTTITTAQVAKVLTVPVSAVPGVTSGATRVTVLKDGVPTPTVVTVGAVGGGLAEIRTGLTSGDQVVIADVDSALPTNGSTNVRGLTGGGGPPGGVRVGAGGGRG
jgi:multidrug efflux pump subunit AcrA (membrane-fusion protein)